MGDPNTDNLVVKQFYFKALSISKLNKVSGIVLGKFHPKFPLHIGYSWKQPARYSCRVMPPHLTLLVSTADFERQSTLTSLGSVLLGSDSPGGQQVSKMEKNHSETSSFTRKFLQFLGLSLQFPISSLDLISSIHGGSRAGLFWLFPSFLLLICLQVKIYAQWCLSVWLAHENRIIKTHKMPQVEASVTLFSAPAELCLMGISGTQCRDRAGLQWLSCKSGWLQKQILQAGLWGL